MMKRLIAFAALTLWIWASTWPAQAKTKPRTFVVNVPFEFVVANRALPAGAYQFQMVLGSPTQNDSAGVLAVRSLDGRYYASTVTGVAEGVAPSDGPKLIFSRTGDRASLSQLWEPGNSMGLTLRTATAETEVADQNAEEVFTLPPSRQE